MPATIRATLAPAHWMGDRVHGFTPYVGLFAHVSLSPGLADTHTLVIWVADSAYGGATLFTNHSHFATRENDRYPVPLLGGNLGRIARSSTELAALSGRHLNVVNLHT